MKKLLLAFALFAGAATTATTSQAQVRVSFNIGSQPLWGPTGYDYAEYYYLPDVDAYYNVSNQQFIYQDGGRWGYHTSLPGRYRNYDLYNGYKVVINDRDPWLRHSTYYNQYRGYRGRHGQAFIRDSRDNRYWENANHPYHSRWQRDGAKSGDVYYNGGYRNERRGDGYRDERRDDRRDYNRGERRDDRRDYNRGERRDDRRDGYRGNENRGGDGNDHNRGGNGQGNMNNGNNNNGQGNMNNGNRGNGQETPQQGNGNSGGEPRQGGRGR